MNAWWRWMPIETGPDAISIGKLRRQPKLRDHRFRRTVVERKEIERPGIAVVGGDRGCDEQTCYAASSRHPVKGFGSLAGPCEEKIGAAGYRRDVILAHARKHRRSSRKLVATCR